MTSPRENSLKTWDEIVRTVKQDGGVTTVYAQSLRLAGGHGRLTLRINEQISDELHARGLGHVPSEIEHMPTDQGEPVRIYDATSALGKVISAVMNPGAANDQVIREAINGDAKDLLEKVRALVEAK